MLQTAVWILLGAGSIMAVFAILFVVGALFAHLIKKTQLENKCFDLGDAASKMSVIVGFCAMFIQLSLIGKS